MRSLGPMLSAAGAIFKRDLLLFASYRTRAFSLLFSSVVSLTLFYYVSRLVRSPAVGTPDDYYGFVVVGLIIFGVLTSTLSTPVATVRAELQAGTFERMVLSPFGAVRAIASLLLFPVTQAFVLGVFGLTFASLAFGLDLNWPSALLAVPIALLGALAFAPFGLVMSAAVVLVKQTNAGSVVVITGVTLLAGVYFPVSLLPDWIRWASDVQPFTPAVDLLRNLLVGTPLREAGWLDLTKLVGFTLVTLPIALLLLRAAIERSRRRGTIIES